MNHNFEVALLTATLVTILGWQIVHPIDQVWPFLRGMIANMCGILLFYILLSGT